MPLFWRQEQAGPGAPLPRHPAAHWWYTLEAEARAASGTAAAALLALDLAEGGAPEANPALIAPSQAQSLFQGAALSGVDQALQAILSQAADGTRDRTLFAPVLPSEALQAGPNAPAASAFEVPLVPADSTVIAVIDDGIAFAHPSFRMPGVQETRFAAVWQQDAPLCAGASVDVPFGQVFGRAEINRRLAEAGGDEDRFYQHLPRSAGAREPFRARHLHGTHVADLAAGGGRGDAMDTSAERFPLLGVNLPTALVSDTGGTFMAGAMILGVRDILRRTEAMMARASAKFPLVLNLSFGLGGIGKNGGHLIAAALEQAMDYWHVTHGVPMRVVLPAGNTLQSRLAARGEIAPGQPHRAVVRVTPEARRSTYVEIALDRRGVKPAQSSLAVMVTPPAGAGIYPPALPPAPFAMDTALQLVDSDAGSGGLGLAQCGIYHGFQRDFAPEPGGVEGAGMEIVTVALPPNAAKDAYRPLPCGGDWTVEVHLAPGQREPCDIEIRVLRNDVPSQVNPIRQRSWLVDPNWRGFDATGHRATALDTPGGTVRRRGSLNALSGGKQIWTVAAAYGDREAVTDYSSAGPGGPLAEGANVTLHACADDSRNQPGRLAAGGRGAATVRLSGTSVAAPLATRQLALALAEWHSTPGPDPRHFAPPEQFVSRGPKAPADRTGLGGMAR
ncbi:S8 family serine peptidase [Arenibacterium sp. LLYu02]|uniref:S8 family serine peptidase n=1 Tax=Arenibacterium sp. LLYu02 TaxID=3404132 RepID=UPI003B20E197